MLPLKKILCPIDFSEHSVTALKSGIELAEKFDAELHLVNVVSPFPVLPASPHPVGFDIQNYEQELIENSEESLQELAKKHVPEKAVITLEILRGDASTKIIDYAEENDMDLIVLSTHGTGALKHFLFGSVAEKVIRHSKKPVLTIKVF